uniref:V-set and transmembrane domain containing 4a n=1 Tax=Fundulus heteroclitus TaxID=8078 RepID=A0A3Q2QA31_FUNHE
ISKAFFWREGVTKQSPKVWTLNLEEVCHTLNVTVTPGPLVLVAERDNLTLCCRVSERKWSSSVLILRWLFSPLTPPTLRPPVVPTTSPTGLPPSQFLIVRIGIKKIKQYGNYSRRFPQPKFRLFDDAAGEAYRLLIANVTGMDQGFYSCRVQEIRKYRNTWRASSNGTGTTQLTAVVWIFPEATEVVCSIGALYSQGWQQRGAVAFICRCVFVRCADLLTGPAVHLLVLPRLNGPVPPQATQAQSQLSFRQMSRKQVLHCLLKHSQSI